MCCHLAWISNRPLCARWGLKSYRAKFVFGSYFVRVSLHQEELWYIKGSRVMLRDAELERSWVQQLAPFLTNVVLMQHE